MVTYEKKLADAIMRGDSKIELSDNLASCVEKIKEPSCIIWQSIMSALATSAFFWAGCPALILGIAIGLPAVLAVCGGVGGVVFVTLGAHSTLCVYRLLIAAQTTDVLTILRDEYTIHKNVLKRKKK